MSDTDLHNYDLVCTQNNGCVSQSSDPKNSETKIIIKNGSDTSELGSLIKHILYFLKYSPNPRSLLLSQFPYLDPENTNYIGNVPFDEYPNFRYKLTIGDTNDASNPICIYLEITPKKNKNDIGILKELKNSQTHNNAIRVIMSSAFKTTEDTEYSILQLSDYVYENIIKVATQFIEYLTTDFNMIKHNYSLDNPIAVTAEWIYPHIWKDDKRTAITNAVFAAKRQNHPEKSTWLATFTRPHESPPKRRP